MKFMRSLRMELATVIAVFVIIALAVPTFFIQSNVTNMVQQIDSGIEVEGQKISDNFSNILIDSNLLGSEHQLNVLNDVMTNYFKISEIAVNNMVHNEGLKAAGKNTSPALEASVRTTLATIREQSDEFVMFLYVGFSDKRTFTATGWETPDYDPTSRPWYHAAVASPDELIWTAPYIDFATGKLIITAAHTVKDNSGDIVGVIGADVSLEALQNMLNEYQVGETGYVVATDATGLILNHPVDIGKTDPETFELVGKEMPIPEIMSYIQSSDTNLKTIEYVFNDSEKIGVVKKVPGIGATLIANFEKADVLALADESRENFEAFRMTMSDDLHAEEQKTVRSIVLFSLVLMLGLSFIGYLYSNKIAKPIISLTNDMDTISSGDFITELKTKSKSNEIKHAIESLDSLRKSLGQIVKDVITLADDIHVSTEELKHSGVDLSESSKSVTMAISEIAQGATDQATDSEESATAMNELSHVIESLIEFNDVQINQTTTMNKSNEKGLEAVSALDSKTNETIGILKNTNQRTGELVDVVGQITSITETINSIADQTNLLALNASIEAARAGEAGKGFAVVADEIRKLAEETSHSTSRIEEMIGRIESTSDEVVDAIQSLEKISEEQIDANKNVVSEFGEIKSGLEEMIGMIDSSAKKVHEIDSGKSNVVSKIDNIVAVTEETAAATEEVNASIDHQDESIQMVLDLSKQLSDKADKLNNQLKRFNV